VYARINKEFQPEQEANRRVRDVGGDTAEIEARGLYAERNAFFKRMEDGEAEAMGLWRRFRGISVERYVETYGRLNIGFDEYAGESQVKRETVEGVERVLREKGVYEEDDGSWLLTLRSMGLRGWGLRW
jgi:arginyl-tRNA synthetase